MHERKAMGREGVQGAAPMKLLRKNASFRAWSEEICADLIPDRGSGVVGTDPAVARPI